jgi:hypothetical protein
MNPKGLTTALAVLLVASAVLFAIGASIERAQGHGHSETKATNTHAEGEGAEEGGAESHEAGAAESGGSSRESDEQIAGVDSESIPAIIGGTAVMLLLAAGVWWGRSRGWLLAVIVAGILFALADTREVAHQVDESQVGIAAISGVLIALHLAAAAAAGVLLWWRRGVVLRQAT